jgi:hypothetical protein
MCRDCPRAQRLRKWVPTPIWTLGMVQGCDAPAGPSDRMGFAWAARWDSNRMGRGTRTVDHGVQPDPGCARTSRDQHHRKCRRNGLRRLGGLGSCGGVDRVFDPARLRTDAGGPTVGRSPRRRPRRRRCLAARRGFGCHLLQSRRLARRMRRRNRVVGDPQHPCRPVAPAPFAARWLAPDESRGSTLACRTLHTRAAAQIRPPGGMSSLHPRTRAPRSDSLERR